MSKPRLLDLFCGGGGCSEGYHRAGFEVVGVDIESQPRYPFEFIKGDALMVLSCLMEDCPEENQGMTIKDFAVIHASPPCQGYSAMARTGAGKDKPKLIPQLRKLLRQAGKPYVIENVEGAELESPLLMLCGTMFNLRVRRHRLFEIHPPVLWLMPDCTCRHGVRDGRLIGQMLSGKVAPGRTPRRGYKESDRREAIGVPWMTTMEARQAIPPAYTEFIGKRLLRAMADMEDQA